jgi:hypothetical protein
MLSDKDAVATVAVKNLDSARKFYEQTLRLTKIMENEEVLAFKSGSSPGGRGPRRTDGSVARGRCLCVRATRWCR